jgi:peptide/nickel transport system substrate-binding protein
MAQAFKLLSEAGYRLENNTLSKDGVPLNFEFLAQTRQQERLLLSYARTRERLGIAVRIRQVDTSQYWARLKNYDFDLIQWSWSASLSPGNEQINRWSSKAARIEGTLNYPGVENPAVDAMIDALLQAEAADDFVAAVRALDRALLSGDYVIPLFFLPRVWVAYWTHLKYPAVQPLAGVDIDTWWSERAN